MSNPFTVYHASAGSGKTYALVREYLEKCLVEKNPQNAFYGILAITFTNKAAGEMKNRVLEYLQDFTSKEPKQSPLMADLCARIGIPQEELIRRSQVLLSGILHEYDRFSISTIDKFNSKIVRTFALDLDLPLNYEVELDTARLIEEATARLLLKIGEDKDVTALLKSFSDQQMNDDRDWRIEKALHEKGVFLFQEQHRAHLDELSETDPADFLGAIKAIHSKRTKLENRGIARANEMLERINSAASPIGFSGKHYPGWLVKVTEKMNWSGFYKDFVSDEEGVHFKAAYLQKALRSEFLNKKPAAIDAEWIARNGDYLALGTREISEGILEAHKLRMYAKNLFEVAALSMLDKCLTELKEERNVLHISEFNRTIATQVRNEPVLFIYERLGNRYEHYFVDEFQDTSRMQWSNLLPLVHEALSSGGSCMVVGDGKQAIYRWRGGDVQLFLDLTAGNNPSYESGLGIQEVPEKPKPIRLEENWRSRSEVVEFNNALYTQAAASLREEQLKTLYEQANQNIKGKPGGFIKMTGYAATLALEVEEEACAWINEEIARLTDRGAQYKDICILVRKGKEASLIAKYLQVSGGKTGKGIPVVSNDSLLLSTSPEVNVLIQFLRWKAENNAIDAASRVLLYLANHLQIDSERQHDSFKRALKEEQFDTVLQEWLPQWDAAEWEQRNLYEKVQTLTSWIPGFDRSNAYVQFFLDLCHQYGLKKQGTEQEFIQWWKDTHESHSITVPEGLNAVSVMTIHKAKGLEFPVVFVPFAHWGTKPDGERLWYELDQNEQDEFGISKVLIDMNKGALFGGERLAQMQELSEEAQRLDSLNTLYVATTRAVDELYLGFNLNSKASNSVADRIKPLYDAVEKEQAQFYGITKSIGNPVEWEPSKIEETHFLTARKTGEWREKLKVSFESSKHWNDKAAARNYGTLVHRVLQEIQYESDLERVLKRLEQKGIIAAAERESIAIELREMFDRPELNKYFSEETTVRNEAPIIMPGGMTQRPDRLVFHSSQEVSVVDFKTGKPLPKHREQVDAYAHLLNLAHVNVVNKALIYLNPVFVDENW